MRIALLIALAACDAGQRPEPAAHVQPAPVPADARLVVAAPDAAPAPPRLLTLAERMAKLGELPPMTTADGTVVLLPIVEKDGGRGNANLAFELRNHHDQRLGKPSVVIALDDQDDDPRWPARVDAAERLVASRPFVAMTALQVTPGVHQDDFYELTGAGLVVTWTGGRFSIEREHHFVVDRKVPAAWRGAPPASGPEADPCWNPEYLAGVWTLAGTNLVVLDVGYRGNDRCWEPSDQLHVVAW